MTKSRDPSEVCKYLYLLQSYFFFLKSQSIDLKIVMKTNERKNLEILWQKKWQRNGALIQEGSLNGLMNKYILYYNIYL